MTREGFTKAGHKIGSKEIETVLSRINKELKSYKRFELGVINPIYFIKTNDKSEYVLRLTNPFWSGHKTENEVTVINFLRKNTTIPLPVIVDYDFSDSRIGYEYIFMEKVPGKPLGKVWEKLSKKDKKIILKQIAGIFAQLKKFSFSKIGSFKKGMKLGPLMDPHEGPFENFKDYMAACINYRIPEIRKNKRFKKYAPQIGEFVEKVVKKYDKKIKYYLTHGDIFINNVMVKENKITALLDFEWCHSAPLDEEFENFERHPKLNKELEKYFMNLLRKKGMDIAEGYEERKVLYAVNRISMELVCYKHWFLNKPKTGEKFIKNECKKLENILKKYI